MTFRLKRASNLPLILELEEVHAMKVLNEQGRWEELDALESELMDGDGLKEILIEAHDLKELKFVLAAIDNEHGYLLDFNNMTVIIQDIERNT
jgi:hypothetical protein